MLPQLYQPSAVEILNVAASAKRRHPDCASRIDKAGEIISTGNLTLDAVAWEVRQLARWHVKSQSGNGSYIITSLSCPCRDSRAPFTHHTRCCKHSISVALYTKILANRFNDDVRSRNIDLGICVDGTFNAYARRLGFVHVRKVGTAYVFADAASAVRYSLWLAAQQTVAMPTPTLVWAGHSVSLVAA